jgi:hypothetical protein
MPRDARDPGWHRGRLRRETHVAIEGRPRASQDEGDGITAGEPPATASTAGRGQTSSPTAGQAVRRGQWDGWLHAEPVGDTRVNVQFVPHARVLQGPVDLGIAGGNRVVSAGGQEQGRHVFRDRDRLDRDARCRQLVRRSLLGAGEPRPELYERLELQAQDELEAAWRARAHRSGVEDARDVAKAGGRGPRRGGNLVFRVIEQIESLTA